MQVLNILNDVCQTAADCVAAVAGIPAVEGVKHDDLVGRVLEVALHHREFI